MEKITIVDKKRYDKDKNGKPYIGQKTGKPYDIYRITCKERPGKLISFFGSPEIDGWQIGAVVEVEIEEKESNGQVYLNGKLPSKTVTRAEFEALLKRVAVLETCINGENQTEVPF